MNNHCSETTKIGHNCQKTFAHYNDDWKHYCGHHYSSEDDLVEEINPLFGKICVHDDNKCWSMMFSLGYFLWTTFMVIIFLFTIAILAIHVAHNHKTKTFDDVHLELSGIWFLIIPLISLIMICCEY